MVNEAGKTEVITRDLLYGHRIKYEKETEQSVIIEEKKSDNPIIDKLLKTASKKGSGAGYPEFIISFPNKYLIIVIECKADITKHKSTQINKNSEYADEGAL